jgi:hypothetical protein
MKLLIEIGKAGKKECLKCKYNQQGYCDLFETDLAGEWKNRCDGVSMRDVNVDFRCRLCLGAEVTP